MAEIKAQFTLDGKASFEAMNGFIVAHAKNALKDGKPLIIRIDQKQDDRSSAQNRLMWVWIGHIADKTGQDKDSIHHYFKKLFLIDIYKRDDQQFAEMCQSIAAVRKSEPEQFKAIAEHVIWLTSTTKASVEQFTEYLGKIAAWAATKDIYLPVPRDLEWLMK